MVDNHNYLEYLPELSKTLTIMELLDQIPTHLRETLVVLKVVLSYVVRVDPTSPVPLPPLQPNLIWSLKKSIMMDELVAYTPHKGPSYEEDNAQVYNLLAKALAGTNNTTLITRHHRWRNRRSAYLELVTNNMGSEKWKKCRTGIISAGN